LLIILNGYPGVGKLSIGRELITLINGRLLDIHSVYNVAFALTQFRSKAFYETVRSIQDIADALILELPEKVPIVLTEILNEGPEWSDECWNRIKHLAEKRGPIFMVHIHCDLDENKRRILNEERDLKRKPRDPAMVQRNHDSPSALVGSNCKNFLQLDVTKLTAKEAAIELAGWLGPFKVD